MSNSQLKQLKEECDGYWSQYIRAFHPKCYYEGCTKDSEEACHTFKRGILALRWDPRNGLGGCKFHNNLEEVNEKEREKALKMKMSLYGPDLYDKLAIISKENKNWIPELHELEHIAEDLKMRLYKLGIKPVKRRFNEVVRKRRRSQYKKAMERFKEKNGGKTPYQVAYARQKEYLKNKDHAIQN